MRQCIHVFVRACVCVLIVHPRRAVVVVQSINYSDARAPHAMTFHNTYDTHSHTHMIAGLR